MLPCDSRPRSSALIYLISQSPHEKSTKFSRQISSAMIYICEAHETMIAPCLFIRKHLQRPSLQLARSSAREIEECYGKLWKTEIMHYQLPLIKSSFTTLSLWAPSERVCNTAHAVYASSLCHHEQKKRGCGTEEEQMVAS
jgi:hypothetical protein